MMFTDKPKRLGYFSCHLCPDGQSETYHNDKSSLSYLNPNYGELKNVDLLEGFTEGTVKLPSIHTDKVHILRWLIENGDKLDVDQCSGKVADFICHSSRSLKTIMVTPLYPKHYWTIIAVRVRGVIVLHEVPTDQEQIVNVTTFKQQDYYAGCKLNEIVVRKVDGKYQAVCPNHTSKHDSFYVVNKLKVDNFNLLYSQRVHGYLFKGQLDEPIEDMITVQIRARNSYLDRYRWRETRKKCCWLAEAKLSGADKIICGIKGPDNFLEYIETLNADDLAKDRHCYNFNNCANFFSGQLTYINRLVKDELIPYKITNDCNGNLICSKIEEPVEKFIPSWYIESKLPDS